jgi:hypothetical protein
VTVGKKMKSAEKKALLTGTCVAPPALYAIAALAFRAAKTMPECPHEYVVRTPENEAAFVVLFNCGEGRS